MKLKNGQLPTWYVIKRITADHELTAEAPENNLWYLERAVYIEYEECVFMTTNAPPDADSCVSNRSDWTLKRKGGGRVNKRKDVSIGPISANGIGNINGLSRVINRLLPLCGSYKITARDVT